MAGDGNTLPASGGQGTHGGARRTPTEEMYGDLQRAYSFFNAAVFDGQLPECLITLRARGRTNGYFSERRFQHIDGRLTAEIALNPERFYTRTIEACLSTLVHEMVHLWQHVNGTAPSSPYHNKEFSQKMASAGLVTSDTGQPGGARVGQRMTHYIEPDGVFLQLTRQILDDSFRARWADRFPSYPDSGEWRGWQGASIPQAPAAPPTAEGSESPLQVAASPDPAAVSADPASKADHALPDGEPAPAAAPDPVPEPARSLTVAQVAGQGSGDPLLLAHQRSARSKTKWVCPSCSDAAWGKPTLSLQCIPCAQPLQPQHSGPDALSLVDSGGGDAT